MKKIYRTLQVIAAIFAVGYLILWGLGLFAVGVVAESNFNPRANYGHQSLDGSSLGRFVQWSFDNSHWTLSFLIVTILGMLFMFLHSNSFKSWLQE